MITSAAPDVNQTILFVNGLNFRAGASVFLAGNQLSGVVVDASGTSLTADLLLGMMPGSYLLQVSNGVRPGENSSFVVVLGEIGPPRPPGPESPLIDDLTGNVSGSADSFRGALVGDVSGPQGATVVATVGAVTAATVAAGATLATVATAANAPSAIVRRDAAGNFSAGTIMATGAVQLGYTGPSGFQDLVSLLPQPTLSDPSSGQDFGRGAVLLKDRVSNRKLEVGFYQYGTGIFTKGNPGEPFEFWVHSGVLSLKGNSNPAPLRHRFEVRVPSDANGLNFEAGYSLKTGVFGGHIGMWYPKAPLYIQVLDGTGLTLLPGGTIYTGGRQTVGKPSEFQVLAGSPTQVSDLSFGYFTGNFDTVRWKLRRKQDDMFGIVYWPNGEEVTSRSTYFTKDGHVGIGTGSAITARLTVAGNVAFTPADGVAPDAGLERAQGGIVRLTNGGGGSGTWQVGDPGVKPPCDASLRGTLWDEFGGVGEKDTIEICAKDQTDTYAWRRLY